MSLGPPRGTGRVWSVLSPAENPQGLAGCQLAPLPPTFQLLPWLCLTLFAWLLPALIRVISASPTSPGPHSLYTHTGPLGPCVRTQLLEATE